MVAVCAALVPLGRIAAAVPWLAGLVGFATVAAALEGHRFAEVSLAARAGLLLAIHGSLAGGAVLLRLSLAAMPHPATAMLWRVAASWIAAILVLYLAFGLRG